MTGVGAAIYANSSTVVLANSTVANNTGHNVGGCAIKATNARGLVAVGCSFDSNTCQGQGGNLVGGNYASSTCTAGGASLMVDSDMPLLGEGNATNCAAAPKHLVYISSSTFRRDQPLKASCGGSIMLAAAWLEIYDSSLVGDGTPAASAAGAIASTGSAVVLENSVISKHSAYARGGAVFTLRGRFWASNTSFSDSSVVRNDGGGCVYISDATEVRVSGCSFDNCVAPGGGGAIYCQVMYDTFKDKPVIHIANSSFTRCRALQNGGVLSLQAYNMTVVDTLFANNEVSFEVKGTHSGCLLAVAGCCRPIA